MRSLLALPPPEPDELLLSFLARMETYQRKGVFGSFVNASVFGTGGEKAIDLKATQQQKGARPASSNDME